MNMLLTERRTLHITDLRKLCVDREWYTLGNNNDYANLFALAKSKDNLTTADIIEIATDIKRHSDTEADISSICFSVAQACNTYFESTANQTIAEHLIYEIEQRKCTGFQFDDYFTTINQGSIWDVLLCIVKQYLMPNPLKDDNAFGVCPVCGEVMNSELISEYNIKHCPYCGTMFDVTDNGVRYEPTP
jgi:rubrerythrin